MATSTQSSKAAADKGGKDPRVLTSAEAQAADQANPPDQVKPSDEVPGADRETFGDRSRVDALGNPVLAHHADAPPASPSVEDVEQAEERAKQRRQAVKDRVLAGDVVQADPKTGEPTILTGGTKFSDLPEHWQRFLSGEDDDTDRSHLFEPDPLAPGQFESGDRPYFKVIGVQPEPRRPGGPLIV